MDNFLQSTQQRLPYCCTPTLNTTREQKSSYESKEDAVVVPILNVTRKQLQLRTEILFWFQEAAKLDLKLLICKDEVEWSSLKHGDKKLFVSLVDHNEDKEFESMGQVVQVIDHHQLNNPTRLIKDLENDVTVGSCCTLVALRYLSLCQDDDLTDVQIILLLFGPIVLDTICLSETAKRFNEKDIQVLERLEQIMGSDANTRREVYQQLISSKNSLPSNLEDILMKDMKQTSNGISHHKVAVPSISGYLAQEVVNAPEAVHKLEEFQSKHHYKGIVILGIKNDDPSRIQRDLALFFTDPDVLQMMCTKLESESSGLSMKLVSKSGPLVIYNQQNIKASRKVILPLITQALSQLAATPTDADAAENDLNNDPDKSYEVGKVNEKVVRKKIHAEEICTRDVDPDFVVNYKLETVDLPESPEQYTEHKFNSTTSPSTATTPSTMRLTGLESSNSSSSSKGEVSTNSVSIQDPSVSHPKAMGKLPIPSLSSSSPSKNSPKTPQLQSINYYESYFDDSYIGEFTGEVPSDAKLDTDEVEQDWPNVSEINSTSGVIEFAYDSFGPESIVFQNDSEDSSAPGENVNGKEDEKVEEKLPQNGDQEVVSSGKLESVDKCDDVLPYPANFKRNSTLTISQRKKLSPQITLKEIMNTSDDVTPSLVVPQSEDGTKESAMNELNMANVCDVKTSSDFENAAIEGAIPRPTTLPRKKISVDRTYIENAENQKTPDRIPDLSRKQEVEDSRRWLPSCPIGSQSESKPIDMKVIEPYKKVISHAGYYHHYNSVQLARNPDLSSSSGSGPAIITFTACYLPDRSRRDYNYVMDHLFMYVLTTLHDLVADDYILVYFHNSSKTANNMPTFNWLKRCYYMIDRKLRKNLKNLYLVHPTFWLKTLVIMTKPLLSTKFSRKLKFVNNLKDLNELVAIEPAIIPEEVKQKEFELMINGLKKNMSKRSTTVTKSTIKTTTME